MLSFPLLIKLFHPKCSGVYLDPLILVPEKVLIVTNIAEPGWTVVSRTVFTKDGVGGFRKADEIICKASDVKCSRSEHCAK
jgi:hypothetical protein